MKKNFLKEKMWMGKIKIGKKIGTLKKIKLGYEMSNY